MHGHEFHSGKKNDLKRERDARAVTLSIEHYIETHVHSVRNQIQRVYKL